MHNMKTNRLMAALALGMGVMLIGSGDAAAQKKKVIRIGPIKVEGTIQKPQAFYILQRSNLNFEGLELKNSFVPKIVESVQKPPF